MKNLDFEAIFERHHQGLYRFCLSILGNPEDARDALQNTMVKALRSLPGEEREIQLQPWLYRVAHNESIDLLRRRRDQVELDGELTGSGGGLAEEAEVRDRLRTLLADLGELPERQRAALVMRELSGLEFAEIGEAFGTSAAVARQTVYEARLSLQQLKAGREMDCEKVRWELSAEDGRVTRRRDIQAHLHDCADCRAFKDAISDRRHDLAALAPLPVAASAGLLQAVLGGKAGGVAAAAGGTAGKLAATSTLVKSVATVAVVAVVAVPAADRGGLVDTGLFGRGSSSGQAARTGGGSGATGAGSAEAAQSSSTVTGARPANAPAGGVSPNKPLSANPASESEGTGHAGGPSESDPSGASEPTAPKGNGQSAREGDLPGASTHGQETAAAHGGGRESAGSKGQKHAHAPKGHPAKPSSHGKGEGGGGKKEKGEPAPPSAVQAPNVPPDKGGGASLQPSNGNPDTPEEPGAGKSKEAR